jgi:glucosylglycerate synthase
LAEDTFLTDDLLRQLMDVGEVDVLVGISSHDNASTNSQNIRAIEQCFQQFFPRQRAVIIDACSRNAQHDQSAGVQASEPEKKETRGGLSSLRTTHRVTADLSDLHTSGTAHRTILAAADLLRARACAVVSPNTAGLAPDRIANLIRPAYREQFDFVSPLYTRHKFHGLLARNLLYPMSRAIFGFRIRELYSDECGFSGRLAAACANQGVWHEESVRARPEAWMAISAMPPDFRRCQAFLGEKFQTTVGSPADIVEVFRQTVGNLFWCIESYQSSWLDGETSEPEKTFGQEPEITSEPMDLDRHGIFEKFRSGVTELEPILSSILDPETHAEIKNVVALEESKFRFGPGLWVRTVYDFAAAYHHAVIHRDHLVQALAPLYRGMTSSFLIEHSNSSSAEIEAMTEELCAEFSRQRTYLTEKWKAKVEVKS